MTLTWVDIAIIAGVILVGSLIAGVVVTWGERFVATRWEHRKRDKLKRG